MTKILLVEDDKSLREIYGVRLLAEGYDIVSAGDGEEALAIAIKDRPQLILSDVMMPKISGFDMLDILRSTTETRDIKVIMMTALSSEDQRQRGESLGADRYLVKSQVGIEDVVRTVHEVLADGPTSTSAAVAPVASRTSSDTAVGGAASTPTDTPAQSSQPTTPPAPASQVTVPPRDTSASSATPQAPTTPQPSSQPTPPAPTADSTSDMPQPTAPFSTQRPAGLGDRVIHPIETKATDTAVEDLAQRMQRELGGDQPEQAPATPTSEPTPTPPAPTPQPEPAQTTPATTPQPRPAEPTSPAAPRQPIAANIDTASTEQSRETAGDFEETPRADSSQPTAQR